MAVLSFVIDDLSSLDYGLRNLHRDNNFAPTIPVVTSYIKECGGNQATLAQLLDLQNNYGYDFGSHGYNHVKMDAQSEADIVHQLSESQRWMRQHGLRCDNFFVPFGAYNQTVLDTAMQYYRSVRTSDKNPVYNVYGKSGYWDIQNIKTIWLDAVGLEAVKAAIDTVAALPEADKAKAFLVVSYHTSSGNGESFFNSSVLPAKQYAQGKGFAIKTYNDALTYLGVAALPTPPYCYMGNTAIRAFYLGENLIKWNPYSVTMDAPERDTTPPVLHGVEYVEILQNGTFDPMSGVTATDDTDGDITARITVTGTVDTSTVGSYNITYTVSDAAGNKTTIVRTVVIVGSVRLRELPDGTKDTENENGSITRRVGVITFTGAETTWARYFGQYSTQTESIAFYYVLPLARQNLTNTIIYTNANIVGGKSFDALKTDGAEGTALVAVPNYTADTTDVWCILRIAVSKLSRQNVVGLQEYLAANNITVEYPLETPYVEGEEPPTKDTTPPVISGVVDTSINVNDTFDPRAGVTATDDTDGDVTANIVITGNVNTAIAGEYTLTYSVADAAGNTATATRVITVVATGVLIRSLPNGISDILSDDGTQITRNVGVITFTGTDTEGWLQYSQWNSGTYTFRVPMDTVKTDLSAAQINVTSDLYTGKSANDMIADKTTAGIATVEIDGVTNIAVRSISGTFAPTNLAGFKNYLSANNLTVLYPLKTPYTEPV